MPIPKITYQLIITLNGIEPPIWRRILVRDTVSLYDLHTILQIAMGWTDSHLHEFIIKGKSYTDLSHDDSGELDMIDEQGYRIKDFGFKVRSKFSYLYDFGDGWQHTIQVEQVIASEKAIRYPICIEGEAACPPEDVGGIGGYTEFLRATADTDHEEHFEYLEWAGGGFDPEHVDLEDINKRLRQYKRGVGIDAESYLYTDATLEVQVAKKRLLWSQSLSGDQLAELETLPLRRDMLTFLNHLLANRVVGTQSTGNLPLKAVREICEKFVDPPELDTTIGDRVYKLRSESEVWPLELIHALALSGGFVTDSLGKVCQVTSVGRSFLEQPASFQVAILLSTWWHRVDWRIAYNFSGFSRGIPYEFTTDTLASVRELSFDQSYPFESFADFLLAKIGLVWPVEDQDRARRILHWMIQRMLVEPLADLGVLECQYLLTDSKGYESRDLATIQLSGFGKGILQTL